MWFSKSLRFVPRIKPTQIFWKTSLLIALSALVIGLNLSCTNSGTPPPPPPCNPAFNCAAIGWVGNNVACSVPDHPRMWTGGNNHPSRPILASFKGFAVPLNSTNQQATKNYVLEVDPNTPVVLGCEYFVQNGITYHQNFFVDAACFKDDATCSLGTPISPAQHDCSRQCNSPTCITYRFNYIAPGQPGANIERQAGRDSYQTMDQLITAPLPLNSTNLSALLGLNSVCPASGNTYVDAQGNLQVTGSSCSVFLPLKSAAIGGVVVTVPSLVNASMNRTGNTARLVFPDASRGVDLEWYDAQMKSLGHEGIDDISLTTSGTPIIRVHGARHYCVWLYPIKP